MIELIKKMFAPKAAIQTAETDLAEAERDYLDVVAKLEYYEAMSECLMLRLIRLREVVRTKDVLALPFTEDDPPLSVNLHYQ